MTTCDESGTLPDKGGARPVVLARHRPGGAGHTEYPVHLVSLPLGGGGGGAAALCGVRMPADRIETVTPGEGSWCTLCFVVHVTGGSPAPDPAAPCTLAQRLAAIATYRALGWPLLLRGEDVSLALRPLNAVALVIPAILGTEVTELLVQRRCSPSVLAHPALPAHRIILASDPYPVPLGWPTAVHQITGTLPLPPTMTMHGPVFWLRAPEPKALPLCREFDVFAALHTASREPPPASGPMHF